MPSDHLIKLADNFYFVRGENGGRFPSSHGFLFTGPETVLIDAGIGEENIKELDRNKRIDTLIITHSHPDHIRAWHLLADRRLLLPLETPDSVVDLQLLGERFTGSQERGQYWARVVHDVWGIHPLREPDGRFGDGDVLSIGGAELEAIRVSGHIDDHYCFYERSSRTLLTTDVDFTSFGPWYANPESDIETFQAGVHRLMAIPYRRVCSSHRSPLKEGDATAYFEAFLAGFDRHRSQVLELCECPTTLEELVAASPIYGNAMPDKRLQHMFEANMIAKNLELLVRDGLIVQSDGRYVRTSASRHSLNSDCKT
ncbi:MAG: MBL fold metallo-hydrolase [Thermodesulfobacteriota bacterium]